MSFSTWTDKKKGGKTAKKEKEDSGQDPKPEGITRASVQADMAAFLKVEFPDANVPEDTIKHYALLHLLTGLDPGVLDRVKELETARQAKL